VFRVTFLQSVLVISIFVFLSRFSLLWCDIAPYLVLEMILAIYFQVCVACQMKVNVLAGRDM
jgi:hypothetical protein